MAEYIQTYDLPANGTVIIPLPNGKVHGVYSTSAANISWIQNGIEGRIRSNAIEWEPLGAFCPLPTSALKLTNTTAVAATITLRLEI